MSDQKVEEKVPTAEELQERSRNVFKTMFNCEPPEDKKPEPNAHPSPDPTLPKPPGPVEEPKVEPKAEEPPKPVEPAPPTTPTTPAPTPVTQPPAQPVAPAPVRIETPTEEPVVTAPVDELGEDDRADYEALVFLEQQDPKKYAGKAAEFVDFTKKNYAYQDAWLDKNPGKDFNADDEEHAEWYAANQPKGIERKVIDEAKDDIRIERMVEKRMAPIREEHQQEKARKAFHENLPTIATVVTKNLTSLVELVNPELTQHLKDDKGKVSIGKDSAERIRQADPIAARELEAAAMEVEPMILELEKTAIPELNFVLDPKRNPLHAQIHLHLIETEKAIKAKPAAEQVVEGRQFVTMAEYNAKVREIQRLPVKAREAQLADYEATIWTAGIDDVEAQIVKTAAAKAKKIIDDIDSAAKRKYVKADPTAQPAAPAAPATPSGDNGKPRPPAIRSESDALTGNRTGENSDKNLAELATSRMFG